MQVLKEKLPYNLSGDQSNSASKASVLTSEGRYRIPTFANLRMVVRKSIAGEAGSLRKRPHTETLGTSSSSALTNISIGSQGSKPAIDYQKFAKIQKNFLFHCQECYPFGIEATFTVNIEQMIVAQDAKYK